ncbi:type VII secretion target [Mycobacteroides immunogenum]|uniref:type VII secretion target n=1 Tax=Mycobacteroides immunogenum TaxID=83262 RepID=UPI0025B74958|nr:type VII secretion target [Mycobacteroides immunogenum]WJR35003.1 type VII secretion target [Mycobacteroides immunogenum]
MPPSKKQLNVSIARMNSASKGWQAVSSDLSQASDKISELKFSKLEAGIFQHAYQAYIDAASYVQERMKEGSSETSNISSVLKANADTYQREEDNNTHAIKGLY